MSDPFDTYQLLCDAYIRYIQTALGFNSDRLEAERDALLRANGLLFQEPRFEPIFPYPSSDQTLSELCQHPQLPSELGDFLAQGGQHGLAPEDRPLYQHQAQAIEASVVHGQDVVVTTGTGSGKTECFLLPIFSHLIQESKSWKRYGARNPSHPQRQGENRPAAVRALILYPLNALVEDQLMRLRCACDSPEAREWLKIHRGDNRFYFARYTGLTPVSGQKNATNLARLRDKLEELRRQALKAQDYEENRYFFSSTHVDTAEMWSRWDMQDSPPDILITNYAMLNIMLIRDLEQPIFEATREWLERENSLFHLVVDELHSYRGTAGSEVAYLLRTLFDRLGLEPDSPKLRVIASSASLEGDEGREYLRQFFGRSHGFKIIGSPPHPDRSEQLRQCLEYVDKFEAFDRDRNPLPLDAVRHQLDLRSAMVQLCNHEGRLHAATVSEMVNVANDISPTEISESTIRGFIRYLIQQKDPKTGQAFLPLRVHCFFKNFEGIWVCSNPECPGSDHEGSAGKLFANRRVLCDKCGSRVLELLLCQTCGEVFLGGYRQPISENSQGWYLSGDYQELDGLPEKGVTDRSYETYAVIWPRQQPPERSDWEQHGLKRRWTRARFSPSSGAIIPDSSTHFNCYLYKIDHPEVWCSELPRYCAHCGDAWETSKKKTLVNGKEQMYPPIRGMGTGLQKVIQVLTQTLQATIEDQSKRKTIIFSDSRQDAAKYSVGIQWAHYQDMIRLIVVDTMRAEDEDLSVLHDFQIGKTDSRSVRAAIRRLHDKFPDQRRLLESIEDAFYDKESLTPDQESRLATLESGYSFTALKQNCSERFINLGMNPGGYGDKVESSCEKVGEDQWKDHKWEELCEWHEDGVVLRPPMQLESHQRRLLENIELELKKVTERILFARKDMGVEGLGLAWCEPKELELNKLSIWSMALAVASMIRVSSMKQ